jgi:ATP-dependent Clp protease ATP-binding subunit ClpB
MNLNNLTTKAQESIQFAQQLAFESDHQQIENEHLFQGILEIDDNVIPYLFSKLNVKSPILKQLNENILKSFSKVTGASQMLSPKASQTIMNAVSIAKKQGDEFVAIEHLLIALFESKSTVAKLLKDQGDYQI